MSRLFHKKERHDDVVEAAAAVGEVVADGNEGEMVTVDLPAERSGCKTLTHIGTYPLVQQTKDILEHLPPARILAANTKPIVVSVVHSKPVAIVRPVVNIADSVFDKTLSVTEKVVPSLKTKTYQRLGEEIMLPYTLTKTVIVKTTNGTVSIANNFVYEPAHENILKFRRYYNQRLIDTHGKPLIRGSLDFVVGPANRQYERLITRVLPEGKEVPVNGFSNEVDRSVALTFNLVSRLIPAAAKKTSRIIWSPWNYAKHVNDVFNENLDKQEDLYWAHSWDATKNAITELNAETIGHVKQIIPGVRKANRAPAQNPIPVQQEVPKPAEPVEAPSEPPLEQQQPQVVQEAVVA
ncbi:ABR127Cp [Eremothecium gossypii ATCC 10895]|uniref:ABR127Cp n=1 Tax=Eremothecium gossypii (strain ATCC 10895 / CBS 109.51 / FGSC 9923 / NRRL Y-1056) TaxID=284811 RepID=Q75D97_EREGS|nr:ABR127Cp [Eremothecium gossypii ATCC 10895]AAS50898.2 ABR127Cp [Eremothecium gossypii ATCC 10895]AEY95187.1 FABR127Cp [Eremothecium gossypii FDAG1]